MTDTKNVMVYVETVEASPVNASLEVLAKARELAEANGEEAVAVIIDKDAANAVDRVVEAGAHKVITVKKEVSQGEEVALVLVELMNKYEPTILLAPATQLGKDVTPLVAKKFNTDCAVDVMNISKEGDNYVLTCPVYGGTVLNDIVVKGVPVVASIRSGSFAKELVEGRTGEIIEETVEISEESILTKVIDVVKEIGETVNLEEAEVIVSGGRGMGSKENFTLCEQLAEVCGGVVGATRPAIEDEWIPRSHQVGMSGKIVAPKLYIACGISGAMQHISGMIGSGYIIAINKDEDAPIFNVADVGIVGDVNQVMPLLIEEFKKAKAQ